jgi:hypothetical protein
MRFFRPELLIIRVHLDQISIIIFFPHDFYTFSFEDKHDFEIVCGPVDAETLFA